MHRTASKINGAKPKQNAARWQLQDAKARLSRVVKDAQTKGPQIITVHGEEVAVIESMEDYRRRTGDPDREVDWLEALLKCPPGPPLVIPRNPNDTIASMRRVFD